MSIVVRRRERFGHWQGQTGDRHQELVVYREDQFLQSTRRHVLTKRVSPTLNGRHRDGIDHYRHVWCFALEDLLERRHDRCRRRIRMSVQWHQKIYHNMLPMASSFEDMCSLERAVRVSLMVLPIKWSRVCRLTESSQLFSGSRGGQNPSWNSCKSVLDSRKAPVWWHGSEHMRTQSASLFGHCTQVNDERMHKTRRNVPHT